MILGEGITVHVPAPPSKRAQLQHSCDDGHGKSMHAVFIIEFKGEAKAKQVQIATEGIVHTICHVEPGCTTTIQSLKTHQRNLYVICVDCDVVKRPNQ